MVQPCCASMGRTNLLQSGSGHKHLNGGSDKSLKLANFSDSPFSMYFKLGHHQVGYENSLSASSAGKMGS